MLVCGCKSANDKQQTYNSAHILSSMLDFANQLRLRTGFMVLIERE